MDNRLQRLIELARGDNWVAQKDAAYRLGETKNPQAVPVLIELLSHKIIPIRINAIQALARIGDRRALEPVRERFENPFSKVREAVFDALCHFRDLGNLPVLAAGLFDNEMSVREKAHISLKKHLDWLQGQGEMEKAAEFLCDTSLRVYERSKETDPFFGMVIKELIRYLGVCRERKGIPLLKRIASEGNEQLQAASLRALGKLNAQSAVDILLKALNSENRIVHLAAVEGLSQLGSPEAVPFIAKAITKCRDRDEQRLLGEALSRAGTEEAVNELIKLLGCKKITCKLVACAALEKAGDRRAIYPVVQLFMNTKNRHIRRAAGKVIGKFGGEKAGEALLGVLREGDCKLRGNVVEILGQFGDRRVIEVLAYINARDIDQNVKVKAAEAMQWIARRIENEGDVSDYYFLKEIMERLNMDAQAIFHRTVELLRQTTRDPVILKKSDVGEDDE